MYEKVFPNGKVGVYTDTHNLLYYKRSERSLRLEALKDQIAIERINRQERAKAALAKSQKDWEDAGYPGLEEWL